MTIGSPSSMSNYVLMVQPAERAPSVRGARYCMWLLLTASAALLYLASLGSAGSYRRHILQGMMSADVEEQPSAPWSEASFAVDTAGCRIPALDPWDPLIRPMIGREKPIDCGRPPLVTSDESRLYIREEHLSSYYKGDSTKPLHCCYISFWHPNGDPNNYEHGVDDVIELSKKCTPFINGSEVGDAEFVKVECRQQPGDRLIYKDYHAFVPLKTHVEERCRNATQGAPEGSASWKRPSVLLIGVDAMSRLNFHRQMNGTIAELRRLGVIEMLGYNKVGDNTFPNLVSVLSGMPEHELRNACWPTDNTAFDNCPWIWKNYTDAGYRTVFGEDAPWMGIFNFLKVGFVQQPTDYYARPYMKLAEDDVGHDKRMNAKLCLASRMTAEVLLEYAGKVTRALRNRRYFALFWGNSLSHDYLNYPSAGDFLYVRLLRDLEATGRLEDTLVVLMSDHGIRWGPIRETYQGRLEERLPMLSLLVPTSFSQRFPAAVANLRRNARRLSSPFDLHETLLDVLRAPRGLDADTLRARSHAAAADRPAPRGLSLFTELPATRTCTDAGIEPHWCTCQESKEQSPDSTLARRAAAFLVSKLNALLESHRECAPLVLAEIRSSRLLVPRKSQLGDGSALHSARVDILVTVRTQPGDAVFEATVRLRPQEETLALAGAVSRLNQYGKQSACMHDFRLKLYCYCPA